MATSLGTDFVTSITNRYVVPEVVDNVYNSNPITFRMLRANKKLVQGGTHIEVPLMYRRFGVGGAYRGYDQLNVTPSDTLKNGALDWKQYYVPVSIDGRTLIITDSPLAIANSVSLQFGQAKMEMAENIAYGLWSDGTDANEIDGLKAAIDDGGVAASYAAITRSANTWWNSFDDSSTGTLTLDAIQSMHGSVGEAGRQPTIICSRQEQYNRFWKLCQANQEFPIAVGGSDEILASAGFTNLLFNNTPWVVDSHVFDGPNASNSAIVMLNEDYMFLAVSPRADFYVEPFQTPVDQDAMTAKMLWAGNLVVTNCARQGKLTNISA
jgi:hypothetical protein